MKLVLTVVDALEEHGSYELIEKSIGSKMCSRILASHLVRLKNKGYLEYTIQDGRGLYTLTPEGEEALNDGA